MHQNPSFTTLEDALNNQASNAREKRAEGQLSVMSNDSGSKSSSASPGKKTPRLIAEVVVPTRPKAQRSSVAVSMHSTDNVALEVCK